MNLNQTNPNFLSGNSASNQNYHEDFSLEDKIIEAFDNLTNLLSKKNESMNEDEKNKYRKELYDAFNYIYFLFYELKLEDKKITANESEINISNAKPIYLTQIINKLKDIDFNKQDLINFCSNLSHFNDISFEYFNTTAMFKSLWDQKKFVSNEVGLDRVGYTCWMNATLQMLFHNLDLNIFKCKGDEYENINENLKKYYEPNEVKIDLDNLEPFKEKFSERLKSKSVTPQELSLVIKFSVNNSEFEKWLFDKMKELSGKDNNLAEKLYAKIDLSYEFYLLCKKMNGQKHETQNLRDTLIRFNKLMAYYETGTDSFYEDGQYNIGGCLHMLFLNFFNNLYMSQNPQSELTSAYYAKNGTGRMVILKNVVDNYKSNPKSSESTLLNYFYSLGEGKHSCVTCSKELSVKPLFIPYIEFDNNLIKKADLKHECRHELETNYIPLEIFFNSYGNTYEYRFCLCNQCSESDIVSVKKKICMVPRDLIIRQDITQKEYRIDFPDYLDIYPCVTGSDKKLYEFKRLNSVIIYHYYDQESNSNHYYCLSISKKDGLWYLYNDSLVKRMYNNEIDGGKNKSCIREYKNQFDTACYSKMNSEQMLQYALSKVKDKSYRIDMIDKFFSLQEDKNRERFVYLLMFAAVQKIQNETVGIKSRFVSDIFKKIKGDDNFLDDNAMDQHRKKIEDEAKNYQTKSSNVKLIKKNQSNTQSINSENTIKQNKSSKSNKISFKKIKGDDNFLDDNAMDQHRKKIEDEAKNYQTKSSNVKLIKKNQSNTQSINSENTIKQNKSSKSNKISASEIIFAVICFIGAVISAILEFFVLAAILISLAIFSVFGKLIASSCFGCFESCMKPENNKFPDSKFKNQYKDNPQNLAFSKSKTENEEYI